MTVIAYKAGVIAADSMEVHENGLKLLNSVKVFVAKGCLLGYSGDLCPPTYVIKKWFNPKGKALGESLRHYKFDLLAILPGGVIRIYDNEGHFEQFDSFKFMAVGAGATYAMGAMAAGASAVKAAEITTRFSEHCGGRIHFKKFP